MSRKHNVVNGVGRMAECARHIGNFFKGKGYEVQELSVNDPVHPGMLVQVRNSSGASGFFKTVTGLRTCATLKLIASESDLSVEVLGGKWLDKAAVNLVSWVVLWPLFVTSLIGTYKQKKLLDYMFSETMSVFTS